MALNKPRIEEIIKYVGNKAKKAIVISAIPLAFISGGNLAFINGITSIRTSSERMWFNTRKDKS